MSKHATRPGRPRDREAEGERTGALHRAASFIRRAIGRRVHLGAALFDAGFAAIAVACAIGSAVLLDREDVLSSGAEQLSTWIVAGLVPGALFRVGRALDEGPAWIGWTVAAGTVSLCVAAVVLTGRRARLARTLALGAASFATSSTMLLYVCLHAHALVGPGWVAAWIALAAALIVAVGLVHRAAPPTARRVRRIGAAVYLAGSLAGIVALWRWQAHDAERAAPAPFLAHAAYDVLTAGEPRALMFTDQSALMRADPSEAGRAPESLIVLPFAERLIPSADPGAFYMAASARGARRVELGPPLTVSELEADVSGWSAAMGEDPIRRRLIVLNEWDGTGTVFSLPDGGRRRLDLSDHTWTVPWIAVDAELHRAFVTSMLDDGDVQVLNLDTLEVSRRQPDLFVYHSVIDHDRGVLWATRPVTGELLALDLDTLAVRARIRLRPGPRDVALDPVRGHLFVNTYPFGDVFRVDAANGRVLERSACGWRCRRLHLDAEQRVLWTSSLSGIRRFAVDEPLEGR